MKKESKCSVCGKIVLREIKHINAAKKHGWAFYCSKKCRSIKKTTSTKCECANCGKEIYRIPSQLKRSKSGQVFCSRHCSTILNNKTHKSGEKHPNYNGGQATYRKKALALKQECCVCGYDIIEVLEVHHIDCDRGNNNINNLLVVCPTHHKELQLGILKLKTIRE